MPRRASRPPVLGATFDDVLAAARADAGWAFRRLYDAYGPVVAAYVRRQGTEDPDGLTNDVFLRAFTNLTRFEGDEGSFRSWLFTIAHHRSVDERRRISRRPVAAGRDEPGAEDVADARRAPATAEADALTRLGTDRVHELLEGLSPDQRDVLLLRVVADLTVEQVAATLGKRPGAVKQLQRRGLEALRRRLGPDDAQE